MSFSVGELYRNIFMRIPNRMPEDPPDRCIEREHTYWRYQPFYEISLLVGCEGHPAPIHLVFITIHEITPKHSTLSQRRSSGYSGRSNSEWKHKTSFGGFSSSSATPSRLTTFDRGDAESTVFFSTYQLQRSWSRTARENPKTSFRCPFNRHIRAKRRCWTFVPRVVEKHAVSRDESQDGGRLRQLLHPFLVSLPASTSAYFPQDAALLYLRPILSENRITYPAMRYLHVVAMGLKT